MMDFGAPAGRSSELRWIYLFISALAFLLCVRLLALSFNQTDLFFDEAQYWYWSLEPAFGYYSKPPLIAWIVRLSTDTCGMSEFCIRLPSPLIHTVTAVVIMLLGRLLYDLRIGVIAGLAFATLPGVTVSSSIISTDVPLLMCWAVALLALVLTLRKRSLWPALLLGLALGVGLNAKYAMAWFVVCLAVYVVATPERRDIGKEWRLYLALAIGLAMIVPNLYWNYANSFATFSHTADNANWGGSIGHPRKAAEFFLAQFGVFGPIMFGALLVICWRAWKQGLPEPDRLLLAFSLPLVVIITLQAFLSRAHANWAAVAYVAATILVIATMIRDVSWTPLKFSFGLHVLIVALYIAGTSTAGNFVWSVGRDPFARTLGWRGVAEAAQQELDRAQVDGRPYAAVIGDTRPVAAELLYYLRNSGVPVYAWRHYAHPRDHFEMARAFDGQVSGPVLLVSELGKRSPSIARFATSEALGNRDIPAGKNNVRSVALFALSGYASK